MAGQRRRRRFVALAAAVAVAAACSSDDGATADETTTTTEPPPLPADYEGYTSATYADDAHWLCKPGIATDVCRVDLDATAVAADGSAEVVPHEEADDPPVDCFYVYPTTSRDPGMNSDLVPAEGEEIVTVRNQVARLSSTCRIFAPVYRQVTLAGISGGGDGAPSDDRWATAYRDVLDAFRHYVATESEGRGFVLVGHSQGAGMITRLIQDEIDAEPRLRDRLVAAYILGSSVQVPEGEVVGGSFTEVPLCEAEDQTGCVVTYSSYRATRPPTDGAFFGRAGEGTRAACVHPGALGGGPATLHPYFLLDPPPDTLLGGTGAVQPFADPARRAEVRTPWVTYPDFVEGECRSEGDYTYLALTVLGDPADARVDDIGGDLTDAWGMHLVDANVAMGDIEALVASQARAYAG